MTTCSILSSATKRSQKTTSWMKLQPRRKRKTRQKSRENGPGGAVLRGSMGSLYEEKVT